MSCGCQCRRYFRGVAWGEKSNMRLACLKHIMNCTLRKFRLHFKESQQIHIRFCKFFIPRETNKRYMLYRLCFPDRHALAWLMQAHLGSVMHKPCQLIPIVMYSWDITALVIHTCMQGKLQPADSKLSYKDQTSLHPTPNLSEGCWHTGHSIKQQQHIFRNACSQQKACRQLALISLIWCSNPSVGKCLLNQDWLWLCTTLRKDQHSCVQSVIWETMSTTSLYEACNILDSVLARARWCYTDTLPQECCLLAP